ncbi:MAG: prephenate dehydratase [Bryobacteraceae bacterium]|nr:prephenate dehydratase [Bryobacteraceae bacterium]
MGSTSIEKKALARPGWRIAFQGERGAFSELAARQFTSGSAHVIPCERFEQVFQSLESGTADAAAIPIENTLHGSVHENYDHLLNFDVRIVGETSVRIVHNLIANPGVKWSKIRRVYSHPVALNQCVEFFRAHPELERMTYYDTAGSVKMITEQKLTDAAAIASSVAAETYGAKILKKSIEDDRQNFTRFFLLRRTADVLKARKPEAPISEYKISLVFTVRNTPGSLFRSLAALALRDISLAKIESRPIRGRPWEYLFYLDFLGHLDEPRVQNALAHLGELADSLRVLGCYRR